MRRKNSPLTFMTGFGVDGSDKEKQEDFEGVRGAFESNPLSRQSKSILLSKRLWAMS
ncbi:MAG: hypothetical protein ACLRS8_03885 [Parabacteroides merdae]